MALFGITYSERAQLKIYSRVIPSCFSLSEYERLVLLFILQRTVGWRKAWEVIAPREFEVGAFRRKAGQKIMIVRGTGLAPGRVIQAVQSLRTMGAIETHEYPSRTAYRVIEDWCHPDLPQEGDYAPWRVNEVEYRYSECANDEK